MDCSSIIKWENEIKVGEVIGILVPVVLFLFGWLHVDRKKRRQAELDELAKEVRPLAEELQRTLLFTFTDRPEEEVWEFGFQTLGELVKISASAKTAVDFSKFADRKLRNDVSNLHTQIQTLRGFKDSWELFKQEQGNDRSWAVLQQSWPDYEDANNTLRKSRPVIEAAAVSLSEFLRQHGGWL